MTTAQLTGRIEMDLQPTWQRRQTLPCAKGAIGGRPGSKKKAAIFSTSFIVLVVQKMESSDTLADRIVGYGLCGITGFYLTAHLVRALFL